MSHAPAAYESATTSGFPEVEFGRIEDGLLAARVGEHAYAMAAARNGRHYLVSGWRIRRPMAEWTHSDFYGHSGELSDEAAFRNKVLEQAEHQREMLALDRREDRTPAHTPWGPSQGATIYADGVIFYSTAGHGGFHLSPERNAKVHFMLSAADGYYEEDEAWAIVAVTFPHLFTGFERRCAERTIKDSYPDAWEAIAGTVLQPGESRKKDERAFHEKHANDWIVVSALRSRHERGLTEVIATKGGKRGERTATRRYLVPDAEYGVSGGSFGFVIDEERHRRYDGPSSFAGWQPGAS